jgi:hypothetical protein
MQPANRFAFKEWAVICAALGTGRQSLILRKGGIHEGREGFRVEQAEFWLFPTNFHQAVEDLTEEYRDLWDAVRRNPPSDDVIPFRYYAIVEQTLEVTQEPLLPRLAGLHGWSDRVIHDRFHYKRLGLFALLVRIYELPDELRLPNSPHFAGCRSWVDLPEGISTEGLQPVISDEDHAERMERIRRSVAESCTT